MSVTVTLKLDDQTQKKFARILNGRTTTYEVDDEIVHGLKYVEELKKYNVIMKGNHFLVYQSKIGDMAMMKPKDRTKLFEQLCGSIDFKESYDKLKTELTEIEEKISCTLVKKKISRLQLQEAKKGAANLELLRTLQKNLGEEEKLKTIFHLYVIQNEQETFHKNILEHQVSIQKLSEEAERLDVVRKNMEKEIDATERSLSDTTKNIYVKEVKLSEHKSMLVRKKCKTNHCSQNLEDARKKLQEAKNHERVTQQSIVELENDLVLVENNLESINNMIYEDVEKTKRTASMETKQMEEFVQLKELVKIQNSNLLLKLESKRSQRKILQDQLDEENRRKQMLKHQFQKQTLEEEKSVEQLSDTLQNIINEQNKLVEQKTKLYELQDNWKVREETLEKLSKELAAVNEELESLRFDKYEIAIFQEKRDIIKILKTFYPGVIGRVIDCCRPINKKYEIAVTRVLGEQSHYVIVDKLETAIDCTKYLKANKMAKEGFIPLKDLKSPPTEHRLRSFIRKSFKQSREIQLATDVISYEPEKIKSAILTIASNTIICNTSENVFKMSKTLKNQKANIVALNGTMIHASGEISGGEAHFTRQAKQWNEKRFFDLKSSKERLQKELHDGSTVGNTIHQLKTLSFEIENNERKLEFLKVEQDFLKTYTEHCETNKDKTTVNIQFCDVNIKKLQEKIEETDNDIKEYEKKKLQAEENAFTEFCGKYGINDIHQFDDLDISLYEEKKAKLLELECRKSDILSELASYRSRTEADEIPKLETDIQKAEEELTAAKYAEERQQQEIEKSKKSISEMKELHKVKSNELQSLTSKLNKVKISIKQLKEEIAKSEKSCSADKVAMTLKTAEFNDILKDCKINKIKIPFVDSDTETERTSSSATSTGENTLIMAGSKKIDLSALPRHMRKIDNKIDIEKIEKSIAEKIDHIKMQLEEISASGEEEDKLLFAHTESVETQNFFKELINRKNKIQKEFTKIHEQRLNLFKKCFDQVSGVIDGIYKELNQSKKGTALLSLTDSDDPFNSEITLCCVVPGKPCIGIESLSGGEQVLASLCLILAMNSFKKSQFLILDEIDVALDYAAAKKVSDYFRNNCSKSQTILITHKPEILGKVDTIIGITSNQEDQLNSEVIALDLTEYQLSNRNGETTPTT